MCVPPSQQRTMVPALRRWCASSHENTSGSTLPPCKIFFGVFCSVAGSGPRRRRAQSDANNANQRPVKCNKRKICKENMRGREKGEGEGRVWGEEERQCHRVCVCVYAQERGSLPRGRGEGTPGGSPFAGAERTLHVLLFPCAGAD